MRPKFFEFSNKLYKKHKVLFVLMALLSFFIVFAFSFYLYISWLLPLPSGITDSQIHGSIKIFDRKGQLLYENIQASVGKKTHIPLQNLPKNFINATLAAEDINFYNHGGVDFFAIGRAIFFNVREGRIVSGGSTITQQLIRNLLGYTTSRGYSEKIMEAIYAVRVSNVYSKDQILEQYLNTIYYGNLAYGSESAALDYFGKHVYDLDLAESSLLAGLPQQPSYYNPFLYFDRAKKRQKYVLDQMVKYGHVDAESAAAAEREELTFRKNVTEMKAPHFVRYVLNQLPDLIGDVKLLKGGINVYTTLDYDLEIEAERIVTRQIKKLSDKHVTNGAVLSLEPATGKILVWVGSENYFNDDIDGQVDIITSLRQPGSSIKPLTYLLALEKGFTPATVLKDIPVQFETDSGPYSPKNYDLDYHGPVRLREALASSFNIPAVQTLNSIGLMPFISFLQKLGIETLDKNPNFYGLALTLGGGEVRVIDMAKAFNVIANYGNSFKLSSVEKITNDQGQTLFTWEQPEKQFVLGSSGREHAYQIIDILKDPNARLKGFGEGNVLEISHEAAVKTGTTRNFRDNWTIGFTPQLLTAVWVGNADASPMQNMSGVDGAGPIWHDFMESALQSIPQQKFKIPSRLHQVEICALSGLLPTDLCHDRLFEWFVRGTEPKEKDNYYQNVVYLASNGHLVRTECINNYPEASLQQKTVLAYPAEFQFWASKKGLTLAPYEPCDSSKTIESDYSTDYPTQERASVSLENPVNRDEYSISSALPVENQKITFRVGTSPYVQKVTYILDSKILTSVSEPPFSTLWTPVKGQHKLKAIAELYNSGNVESSEIEFSVK